MTTLTRALRVGTLALVIAGFGSVTRAEAQSWVLHANDGFQCGTGVFSGSGDYFLGCAYVYSSYLDSYTETLTFQYFGSGPHYEIWNSSYDGAWGSGHQNQYAVNEVTGFAVMQGDGNFVFYDDDPLSYDMWSTSTCCIAGGGTYLNVQDDANFVVYDESDTPLWSIN